MTATTGNAPAPPGEHVAGSLHEDPRSQDRRTFLAAALFTLFWAACCNALLDVAMGTNGLDSGFGILLREKPLVFALNVLLVWVVLLLLVAILGRVLPAAALLLLVVVPVALANNQKLSLRREPLYPADLAFVQEPGFLREMVGTGMLVLVGLGLVALLAGYLWVRRQVLMRYPRIDWGSSRRRWWGAMLGRAGVLVAGLGLLAYVGGFHHDGNVIRKAYDAGGARWAPWSQIDNYMRHGFVAGLAYNLDVEPMDPPNGYGPDALAPIIARYADGTGDQDPGKGIGPGELAKTNVVVVLSEAFTDPTRVPGVTLEEDPLPLTRELMRSTPSGSMSSPLIGGGTANVEFEVLTGQAMSEFTPQLTTPYQMLVPGADSFPSAVGYFKQQGLRTVAIHPYRSSMYQRDRVYPVLGFDQTVFEPQLPDRERLDDGKYISDAAAFDEVVDVLAETTQPAFVQLVTMQNHYPYTKNFDDPMDVRGLGGKAARELGAYARGLQYSDRAIAAFLEQLEASGEPTAVLFYGDHAPTFWSGSSVEKRLGDDAPVLHETPYFLWSNVPGFDRSAAPAVTSPHFLLPLLLERLGAPLPPYYRLLLDLQRSLPVMMPGRYGTSDTDLGSVDELPAQTQRLLADFRMVQYDYAVGQRFSLDRLFPQAP